MRALFAISLLVLLPWMGTPALAQSAMSSRAWIGMNLLVNEAPDLDIRSPCPPASFEARFRFQLDACSGRTPSELLALIAGYDPSCVGDDAYAVVINTSTAIGDRVIQRESIFRMVSSDDPMSRQLAYANLEGLSAARHEWVGLERHLWGLVKYMDVQLRLTMFQRALAYHYFQTGFARWNEALRQNGETAKCLRPLTDSLTNIIQLMPRYEGPVWRGVNLSPEEYSKYVPGSEHAWLAFSSGSTRRLVAESFMEGSRAKVLFRLKSKSCFDIVGLSDKLWEDGVVCLPGTRVRVLPQVEPGVVELEEI